MYNRKSPLLSVVTVVFNGGKTLSNTLDSLRKVKSPIIEYIVIDGKSTDNTLSIINKNLDIIDQFISEEDKGIFDAMNKGINLATGEYTIFLNADDELYSPGFNNAIQKLNENKFSILSCVTMIKSDSTGSIYFPYPDALPYGPSIPHPSTFVKTAILKANPFKLSYKISADYDLFLNLYLKNIKFEILHEITSLFALGGASSNIENGLIEIKNIRKRRLGYKYAYYNGLYVIKNILKKIRHE